MPSMNAIRFDTFGGPDVLHLVQLPVPEVGDGEVLLKVHAASVNPVDYKIRKGKYPAVKADMLPYIPGRDVAGVVETSKSKLFVKGDAVYGVPGIDRGGYAEYVVLKETEAARKPKTLGDVESASVPLAGLTAWQGLFTHGKLTPGQRVLIHGGSGGVGHFAIQFAKAKGAYVITTVSGDHIDFVGRLGADEVINYKTQQFEIQVHGVDLVLDLIGGETQKKSWGVLKRGGIMVSTLTEPSQELAAAHGATGVRFTVTEDGAALAEIADLIDVGKVMPRLSKTFSLEQAAEAQELVEEGHSEGKVVMIVSEA